MIKTKAYNQFNLKTLENKIKCKKYFKKKINGVFLIK
jgi:hypothetical protein